MATLMAFIFAVFATVMFVAAVAVRPTVVYRHRKLFGVDLVIPVWIDVVNVIVIVLIGGLSGMSWITWISMVAGNS